MKILIAETNIMKKGKKIKVSQAKKDNRELNNPGKSEFELNDNGSLDKISEIRMINNEKISIATDPENAKSEFDESLNDHIVTLDDEDPWIQKEKK